MKADYVALLQRVDKLEMVCKNQEDVLNHQVKFQSILGYLMGALVKDSCDFPFRVEDGENGAILIRITDLIKGNCTIRLLPEGVDFPQVEKVASMEEEEEEKCYCWKNESCNLCYKSKGAEQTIKNLEKPVLRREDIMDIEEQRGNCSHQYLDEPSTADKFNCTICYPEPIIHSIDNEMM